jgi:hypothetical protein
MSHTENNQLVLIAGESASGKSASLRNIRNQDRVIYMNTESNKRLPFKNAFQNMTITEPYLVHQIFDMVNPGFNGATDGPQHANFDGVIIDSLTFLMDMFESQYIVGSANTMQGWQDYGQFFKILMQEKVARSDKFVLILAHTRTDLDEKAMEYRTAVPIKGALKNNGIEAYFSTVVATKKVPLKMLEKYQNNLLTITPDDELVGFKHVFQTRLTKETTGERIRSPMGMFEVNETFINNDSQMLLDHLKAYYN